MTEAEIFAAAQRLIDCVNYDMNGTAGRGGNGGLLSTDTLRAADECRLAISRYKASKTAP